METVKLNTKNGQIEGVKSHNHTGRETNLTMIEFVYEGQRYSRAFSKKTGKPYNWKPSFEINLIVK